MKIKPLNNMVLAKIWGDKTEEKSVIVMSAAQEGSGRFIKLRVLDVGNLVEIIKKGDKVIANNLFEIIDPKEKTIGFVNSKDVLGIIEDE